MSNPFKSLNCQLAWTQVLPALQVQLPRLTVLPQTVHCPLCDSDQLVVVNDPTLGGAWTNCRGCGFAGDLIDLAACVWDVDPSAAIAKLDQLELFPKPVSDDDVTKHVRDHVRYRQRIAEFWQAACVRPIRDTNPSLRHLLRKFSLLQQTLDPDWPERAGRFVGSASRKDVEELFSPLSYDHQERSNRNGNKSKRRGGGPGRRKLFNGHGWEDLLVVPFYDLPGRICGFLFAGRNADPGAGDFIFKRANLGRSNQPVREAGVAMLSSLHDGPNQFFGDDVFVIADPVVGLLLQTRRMRDSSKLLPIVLAYFSQNVQTLRLPSELEGRNLVFWGEHPQLLPLAKRYDGLISNFKFSFLEVERRLNHRDSLDWLRLIRDNAVPWITAFRHEFRQLDAESARHLVAKMNFTPSEFRHLAQAIGNDLQDRLLECDPHRLGSQRVLAAGRTIVETKAGWEIEGTGEQICNTPLRIEQVVTTDDGDCFYRCFVPLGDGGFHFVVSKPDVDRRGLFACAEDELLNHDAGVLNFQARWSKHAAFIAMQIRQPEYVTGVGRIGWNPRQRCFQFPKFSIAYGGETNGEPFPLPITDDLPGRHLEPPSGLSGSHIKALS